MIDMKEIVKDIEKKLNIRVNSYNNYKEGTTNSLVLSINNEYLIKTMEKDEITIQQIFLDYYKDINYFQKIVYVNNNLEYICFKYIKGEKLKNSNIKFNVIDEFYKITKSYKKYECNFYGYFDYKYETSSEFLESEILYAKNRLPNLDISKVNKAFLNLKKYKIDKYLLHGDLGMHNMLVNGNEIKVIDAMPLVFTPLYDFYFACLSNLSFVFPLDNLFDYYDEDLEYKKNLFIIVFYIKLSRIYVYDRKNYELYLNYYNELEELLKII